MIFRPTVESDLDRFLPLIGNEPAGSMTPETYLLRRADGQYRPAWTWIAEDPRDARALAVAVWWGDPDDDRPAALDGVFVHPAIGPSAVRGVVAADLLNAAHARYAEADAGDPPEYHFFLPCDWRERPEVTEALAWRQEAARRAGLPVSLERLRFEWLPHTGLPEPSGRVLFHPESDDEVFVDLFQRVLTGTLDATSRKEAEHKGAQAQARGDVAFYRDTMLGERTWWRVARTPDGEVVGFALPSRNHLFPVVGYLGVLPEHRGRGYAREILAETTRILAAETDPERVRADTDLANAPMAAAFERVGYRNHARRLVLCAR